MPDINSELTVEQKFAKLMLQLRIIRPFYSAIYEVMEKRESKQIPTMGVTTNELIYSRKFVDETPFADLLFVVLHEIGHIALQHVARRENREPTLWNIAADLYTNAVLASEFNLKPGEKTNINGIVIGMPTDGCFCSSIDINNDYTEQIYEDLEKQGKSNGYMSAKNGHQTGSKTFKFSYSGSKTRDNFGYNFQDKYKDFTITIKCEDYDGDLVDNGESQSSKKQKADKIVSDAMVRVEMSSSNCGSGAGKLYACIKEMLKSELDWRKLLRKYLIAATSTDSSFSRPDKRMFYQKQIYPGQICSEENTIKGVKVCIDTSGSISDDDIRYFCGQVYQLTKQFNINAELIYWDAGIQSTGEFTGYKEFKRVQITGRGGTDPSVVFNYFDSKKCRVKPVVTLMFTDAYFSVDGITAKQRKQYKDTIWIMTKSHYKEFKPPFGKKALAKFS